MSNLIVKKNAKAKVAETLVETLREKCEDWQKENAFDICIFVKDADSDSLYNFCFEKKAWAKLKAGVAHNVLKALIDIELKKWVDELKNKIQFVFYVGFTESEVEKLAAKFVFDAEEISGDIHEGLVIHV